VSVTVTVWSANAVNGAPIAKRPTTAAAASGFCRTKNTDLTSGKFMMIVLIANDY